MPLSSAIANDTIASCTEFMQKIHHDDDADARHRRISIIIARDRAARRDHRAATAFGMLRLSAPWRAQQMPTTTASVPRRQRQFFPGAVAIAIMHLSTRSSSRGKRLLLMAHPSIITASAVPRPLSSSEHHQIRSSDVAAEK